MEHSVMLTRLMFGIVYVSIRFLELSPLLFARSLNTYNFLILPLMISMVNWATLGATLKAERLKPVWRLSETVSKILTVKPHNPS